MYINVYRSNTIHLDCMWSREVAFKVSRCKLVTGGSEIIFLDFGRPPRVDP